MPTRHHDFGRTPGLLAQAGSASPPGLKPCGLRRATSVNLAGVVVILAVVAGYAIELLVLAEWLFSRRGLLH